MIAETFSTYSLPKSQQLDAWRNWYGAILKQHRLGRRMRDLRRPIRTGT